MELDTLAVMLLDDLRRAGFRLRVEGGALIIAPKHQLTRVIRDAIRTHRQGLIDLLEGRAPTRSPRAIGVGHEFVCQVHHRWLSYSEMACSWCANPNHSCVNCAGKRSMEAAA